jgi:ABC-type multidrug transport system ATPase subunit
VLVNGADLYRAYDALKPLIGYVPQETILPPQLTVKRALRYVARMRLPSDVTDADADERIRDVLRTLQLEARRDVQIGRLSGGQQKRASIAAELIAQPGLLFLDEPTSGLDPGLTVLVTDMLRQLAARGCTVVLISHDVESLEAADRIVFLAGGGRVVFIGNASEALAYFGVSRFPDIYNAVEAGDSEALQQRFAASPHHREPFSNAPVPGEREVEPALNWDPFAIVGAGARRGASSLRQFWLSTLRYAESMFADRRNLALLILQAPIIALFLALAARSADLKPPPAAAVAQAASFGIPAARLAAALPLMLAATATWFGTINSAREIVKELPILRRERLAGLRVAPYLASKIVVLVALCVVQTAILLGITALRADLPSTGALFWAPFELWTTLLLTSIAALGLGLVISSSMTNADRAQSLVPIVLIPQLIFVGVPGTGGVAEWLSYFTITHWSVEALRISCEIPYTGGNSGFGTNDLLIRWAVLGAMAAAFAGVAAWQLSRNRAP